MLIAGIVSAVIWVLGLVMNWGTWNYVFLVLAVIFFIMYFMKKGKGQGGMQ
jgi:hypothetical protein